MSEKTQSQLKELAEVRAAHRSKLREAYQRIYNNPFRTNATIFDPAVFRYEAARAFAREHYKITPRSIAVPIALLTFTVLIQKLYNRQTSEKEALIRSGQSTYYDRALWLSKHMY